MTSALLYVAAAVGEIAGCFAFWAWLRLGQSPWWIVPGIFSLVVFAVLLTKNRCRVRRARLCRLWRRLHRGLAHVAVADRGRPAGPLGPDRRQRLPGRCRDHPVRPAQRLTSQPRTSRGSVSGSMVHASVVHAFHAGDLVGDRDGIGVAREAVHDLLEEADLVGLVDDDVEIEPPEDQVGRLRDRRCSACAMSTAPW